LLLASLRRFPIVGLVGARQVGKTTLARAVERRVGRAVYLDLERPSDSARLADPELYLEPLADRLVIIDEIQRAPALFPVLRGP
jgi:predicted AAA+ superfamily ATPase